MAAVLLFRVGLINVAKERNMFIVTCTIGLLHGLGFSFVLHMILHVTSPDIWQSLLAFNVGVEVGQLTIILVAWPALRLLRRYGDNAWRIGRTGVATACMAVATVWIGQRVLAVIGTLELIGFRPSDPGAPRPTSILL